MSNMVVAFTVSVAVFEQSVSFGYSIQSIDFPSAGQSACIDLAPKLKSVGRSVEAGGTTQFGLGSRSAVTHPSEHDLSLVVH